MVFVKWLNVRCNRVKEFLVYICGGMFFVRILWDNFKMVRLLKFLSKGGILLDKLLLNIWSFVKVGDFCREVGRFLLRLLRDRFRNVSLGVNLVVNGIDLESLFLNRCNNIKLGKWNMDKGMLLVKKFFERLIFWMEVRLLRFLGMEFIKLLE